MNSQRENTKLKVDFVLKTVCSKDTKINLTQIVMTNSINTHLRLEIN